jgi:hypothetical protein
MPLLNLPHLESLTTARTHSAKLVFNAHGALFLPTTHQHRDHKAEGISYEDDYKGNALAAMLTRGRIEIRYHSAFTDADVARILHALLTHPDLAPMTHWHATYQGRPLSTAPPPPP